MNDAEQFVRLQDARAENERLRRVKHLKKAYGINFYRPHAKQDKFHLSQAVGRYARTANRFGKSEMGIAEDIAWCLGGRVWYRETFDVLDGEGKVVRHHEGGRDHPYVRQGIPDHAVKGLILVVDWDMAKKIFTGRTDDPATCGKLFKFLPHESIGRIHTSKAGNIDQVEIKRPIEFGGGISTLTIDTIESWKHNRLSSESADWDFVHVDEPCPEAMFKGYARGLMDRNGRFWFNCTPIDQMWINDMFCPPGQHVVRDANEGLEFCLEEESVTRYIITGTIYDNPHRTPEGVANFKATLTRDEEQCRLYGLPLALAGTVYKEFIYDVHVLCEVPKGWKDYHLPPLDYTIRVLWDVHGARLPQAVLFFATAPDGTVFVYDELFCEPLIGKNAALVKRKILNRNVVDMLIDPRAMIKNPVTNTADIEEELISHGLFFIPASKDLTTGISATKEKLNERHSVTRLPSIYFSPRVKQTLFEFTHYVYDTDTNEPKDKDNHMMENLYRAVLNGLDYVEPITDEVIAARHKPFIVHDPGELHDYGSRRNNLLRV